MIREDKKIRNALRATEMPEPPQDLLDRILIQNELKRYQPVAFKWAIAGCAATVLAVAIWQKSPAPVPSHRAKLVAAKQESPRQTIPTGTRKPINGQTNNLPETTKKPPKGLTGREPAIRIRTQTPRTYLASNAIPEEVKPSMSPIKIGRDGPGAAGTASASMWTQNERGVWVLVEVNQQKANGQSISVVKQTESDCKPRSLLVSSSSDQETSGGRDE